LGINFWVGKAKPANAKIPVIYRLMTQARKNESTIDCNSISWILDSKSMDCQIKKADANERNIFFAISNASE
jgi:hypothetical protein